MRSFEFIKSKIKEKSKLLLMFDYDGTLTPIVEKPEYAKLEEKTKNHLEILASKEFIKLDIITGRQIAVLQKLSGIKSPYITMFGLHGGEIQIGDKIISNVSELKKEALTEFKKDLKKKISGYEGIIIEDKEYTVSLHYRLADEITGQRGVDIFKELSSFYNLDNEFRFQEGKKVIEILPSNFSKSKAVASEIINYPEYFPIYFGDDLTDVSAFREVKKHGGLAIGVGEINFNEIDSIDDQYKVDELSEFIKEITNIE